MSRTTSPRVVKPWMIGWLVVIVVLIVTALNVKVVSLDDAAEAEVTFDPAAYADEHYAEIAQYITDNATELPVLLDDLEGGAEESEFGNNSGGTNAYAFPVTVTGTVGEVDSDASTVILPLAVDGIDSETIVQVQAGPAVSGTALRDVSGTIDFGMFTNQGEYQEVGSALNALAVDSVFADQDPAALSGQEVTLTGTFLRVNPAMVSLVVTGLEVSP